MLTLYIDDMELVFDITDIVSYEYYDGCTYILLVNRISFSFTGSDEIYQYLVNYYWEGFL
jgi:hypothetical protein